MARLALTEKTTPGSYPSLPLAANSADFVWTPAGASFADGFSFPWSPDTLLLVRNLNAGNQTVTINSVPSKRQKRDGAIGPYTLQTGEFAVFGPFDSDGWQQADGKIYGAASASDVNLAVLRLTR